MFRPAITMANRGASASNYSYSVHINTWEESLEHGACGHSSATLEKKDAKGRVVEKTHAGMWPKTGSVGANILGSFTGVQGEVETRLSHEKKREGNEEYPREVSCIATKSISENEFAILKRRFEKISEKVDNQEIIYSMCPSLFLFQNIHKIDQKALLEENYQLSSGEPGLSFDHGTDQMVAKIAKDITPPKIQAENCASFTARLIKPVAPMQKPIMPGGVLRGLEGHGFTNNYFEDTGREEFANTESQFEEAFENLR